MNKFLSLFLISLFFLFYFVSSVSAYWVNGYYRSDGTYVRGHYRSRPNAYTYDNYSYTGPTYSNGYGFNDSNYSGRSYSSNWYTPSYYDSGWDYEDSWSDYNSGRFSYYDWDY